MVAMAAAAAAAAVAAMVPVLVAVCLMGGEQGLYLDRARPAMRVLGVLCFRIIAGKFLTHRYWAFPIQKPREKKEIGPNAHFHESRPLVVAALSCNPITE